MSLTQHLSRNRRAAVGSCRPPLTACPPPPFPTVSSCAFAVESPAESAAEGPSLTRLSHRSQWKPYPRPYKMPPWFVPFSTSTPPAISRHDATCGHRPQLLFWPRAQASASPGGAPPPFFQVPHRNHLSTFVHQGRGRREPYSPAHSRAGSKPDSVGPTGNTEGGPAVSTSLSSPPGFGKSSASGKDQALSKSRFGSADSLVTGHQQEPRAQVKDSSSGTSQAGHSPQQLQHRQVPSSGRRSADLTRRTGAGGEKTNQAPVTPEQRNSTSSHPSSEHGSVFLSLCEIEDRVRRRIAVLHSQDQWARRVRFKDWRAAQVPQLYDGPFWFKFWHRKKRPGARG
ncbi:hypothetical protein CSUI_001029 [Cystoisospora suis]|uniref:Uncharacterized protein n=1 Tax=Cystoisospora suis TaxID=483139 RepID=A0A2C6LEN9_9APIC|nr:hypothetical protein CSUI_001029 [Cystoisospora suis]